MIVIWRGWGLLGFLGLIQFLTAAVFLPDVESRWLFLWAVSAGFVASGLICVHCGTRWNRPVVQHTLYFLRLQFWGWIYLVLAGVFLGGGLGGVLLRGLDRPGGKLQAGLIAVGLGGLLALMVQTALATRRPRPEAGR